MYRKLGATALLLAGGLIALNARDRAATDAAMERAAFAWDRGDYVTALTTYRELLAGADAASVLEPIALQTGELFVTAELTKDGANPVFSPDSRYFSFETGGGIAAGVASGLERVTHVRTAADPSKDAIALDGGEASFCPDGRHVAFLRVPRTPDVTEAQTALAAVAGGTALERAPRQQALARLTARRGQIVLRDLTSNADQVVNTGDLLKIGPTCAADGAVLFGGAAENETAANQIYAATVSGAPRALTQGDGFKIPSKIDAAGKTLLYSIPRQGPFRQPTPPAPAAAPGGAPGAGGGGGGGAANAPTSFGVLAIGGAATTIDGVAPALSRDGRVVSWITRTGPATGGGEQRLLVAATSNLAAPVEIRKGIDRLDAPALSADGSRVAFQMMANDDWELFVVGRDGKGETRLTREIQHDLLPQFLGEDRLLGMIGEARHRRSYVYDLSRGTASRRRAFHNNTIRTIAPEYIWVAAGDGNKLLVVAERDGDTVSAERGVYFVDLAKTVTAANVLARIDSALKAERALRDNGRRLYAPIAADVAKVTANASVERVFSYEKALFDFDSKHITRPGNKLASEYLFNAYKSFGYTPEYQWFSPRQALGGQTANVLATLKGTVNPELVYVVSSHYDSVAIGPGADDDTSGTAALLETARIMAGHPMPATIVFASFTGEEAGLLGSREYVRQAVANKVRIVGALNNDMIGWANDHRLDNTIRYSNPGIRDIQHGAAIQFSNLITYDALYYKSTDAAAYYEAYGDIVGGIGSYPVLGNPHYHQSHDFLEGINHQLITEVSKTTAATLMLLASSPSRIAGLEATATAAAANVSWTPSPEKGVAAYLVTWGTAENPGTQNLRVLQPKVTLPGVKAGTIVRVKAVNAKGMEGWDWAKTVVK